MNHSQYFIQQRKLYMALPLLATPFLVMIFWALGGGTQVAQANPSHQTIGLNTLLPEAQLEGKEQWDKLSLYDQAKSDSMRYEEARENDPYFDLVAFKTSQPASESTSEDDKLIHSFKHRDRQQVEELEKTVEDKIAQLQKVIAGNDEPDNKKTTQPVQNRRDYPLDTENDYVKLAQARNEQAGGDELERMEQMMQMFSEKSNEPDPEMQQIEGVLDKILDIQHPDRVQERLKGQPNATEAREHKQTLTLEAVSADNVGLISDEAITADSVMVLINEQPHNAFNEPKNEYRQPNGFYGLVDRQPDLDASLNGLKVSAAINAVVHDTQELVAGSTVKLRLSEETTIAGLIVPKDQFIYGTCQVSGERLTIKINSIRVGNMLLPVGMSAYDLDGLEGIHIPGAISRDAAKQGTADGLQSMQMMSMNPTIGAQAASAGIETVKGLISKKVKLVKVTVKAGYQVLLKQS